MLNWRQCSRLIPVVVILGLSGFVCVQYYRCWQLDEDPMTQTTLLLSLLVVLWPLCYFLLIAIARYWLYREIPRVPDAELPVCTVVVPAYNEGEHILSTLESICNSDYPAEKLEIIAVNDGSIDGTLHWMEVAAERFPGRIQIVSYPDNRGKRYALYAGFSTGRGDVFISVDSDSIVEPDALAKLATPFVHNPTIGAVSGNVRVANPDEGIYPPMIDTGFTFAFDFIRSGQSVFQCVFCTPGASSAYRRSALVPVLKEWRDQKFMGRPAGIGEDRALTNLILREGWGVTMQRSALIYTNVPDTYLGITRMLLRWERSNIRENMEMYTFIFKDFRWDDRRRLFMLLTLLQYSLLTLLPLLMIWVTLYNILATQGGILLGIIAMALLWSTLPAAINLQRKSLKLIGFCYFYGVLHLLTLFWVTPYAFFTVRNSNWLTRLRANSAGKI